MAISINLYLDTRHTPNGQTKETAEYPVKLAITKDSSTAYIPMGIKVGISNWKNGKVVGLPERGRINTQLQNTLSNAMTIAFECRSKGLYANKTVTEVKDDIVKRLGKEGSPSPRFMALYDSFAERRKSARTKEIYRATAKKIRCVIPNADRISVENIDLNWLEEFDDLLIARGNNPSTRSLDFRNIRAVIKDAKKHKIIVENPFEEFVIPAGESPKRALTIDQFRSLINAKVEPWQQKYLDFFLLSFLLIGINTEDLLHLTCISDGRITYRRAKTGKEMSVKVEPEAASIIDRYRGEKYLLNILDTYSNTHNWTAKVDSVLKEIAANNGLPEVTMYWARHTWATLAHVAIGIDQSTVSEALGHQPEKKVILHYIKMTDYSKIDKANRQLIDYCFSQM